MANSCASVFIWYPEHGRVGHCSMFIGNLEQEVLINPKMSDDVGKKRNRNSIKENKIPSNVILPLTDDYVSWWPDLSRGCSNSTLLFSRNKSTTVADLARDMQEENSRPHVTYTFNNLSVSKMQFEWESIKNKYQHNLMRKTSYRFLGKNCASIVWRILCAGGICNLMSSGVGKDWKTHNLIWTPKKVAVVCNTLEKKGECDKAKNNSAPSKMASLLACMFGLR